MDTKFYLVAKMTAAENMTSELLARLKGMVRISRGEDGCVFYDLHVAQEDSNSFCFIECWQNKEHWDDHMTTPHVKALITDEERLTKGIDISLLHRL
jgi:quinol monooxygenase YgiN